MPRKEKRMRLQCRDCGVLILRNSMDTHFAAKHPDYKPKERIGRTKKPDSWRFYEFKRVQSLEFTDVTSLDSADLLSQSKLTLEMIHVKHRVTRKRIIAIESIANMRELKSFVLNSRQRSLKKDNRKKLRFLNLTAYHLWQTEPVYSTPPSSLTIEPAQAVICVICQSSLYGPAVETECGHFYHAQCLETSRKTSQSCAVCRADL